MAQILGVMIEFDPTRIKQGEAGDLTITVRTLDGLVVDLTGYSTLELRLANYPQRTTIIELPCDSSEDDAENGICACVVDEHTFDDIAGTLEAELVLEIVESRLEYENKSSDFNDGATLAGEDSEAIATIAGEVESSETEGYLVLEDVAGEFEVGEAIEDDGDIPGFAEVAAATEDILITRVKSRTAYFVVDRAIANES
jgi:hypothetical protein